MKRLAKPSIQIQESFLNLYQLEKQGNLIVTKEQERVGEISQIKGLSHLEIQLDKYKIQGHSQKEEGAYQMEFSMEEKGQWHSIYGTFHISRTSPLRTGLSYIHFFDGVFTSSVEMNRGKDLLKIEQGDSSIEVTQEGTKMLHIAHVLHRQSFLNAQVDMSGKEVSIHLNIGNGIHGKWYEKGGMPFLRQKLFRLDKAFYWMILKEQGSFWNGENNFFWNAVDSCYDSKQEDFRNLIFNQEEMQQEVQKEKVLKN